MSRSLKRATPCGLKDGQKLCTSAIALIALIGSFAIGLTAPSASAVEHVWGFKGTISTYTVGGGFIELTDAPLGTVVRGQFRFDDAAVDSNGSANQGDYAYIAFAMAIEGISTIHYSISTNGDVKIANDLPVGPDFQDGIGLSINPSFFMNFPDLGMDVANADLTLTEVDTSAPAVLTTDALPASPPPALINFTTLQELAVLGYLPGMASLTEFDVAIIEFDEPGTVDLPVIPDDIIVNIDGSVTWVFSTLGISLCASGCWIDPPISSLFVYSMTNGARFTSIVDFPSGFGTSINVSVGGSSLGLFGPGDSVDFSGFPGGGVTEFDVSGIYPGADLGSAEAFPLQLAFDSSSADFTMTSAAPGAVPALTWPLAGLLSIGLVLLGARKSLS